jgi:hypothetical protein
MNRFFTSMPEYVLRAWHPVQPVVVHTLPGELSEDIRLKFTSSHRSLIQYFLHTIFSSSHPIYNSLYQSITTVYVLKNYKCNSRDTHVFD